MLVPHVFLSSHPKKIGSSIFIDSVSFVTDLKMCFHEGHEEEHLEAGGQSRDKVVLAGTPYGFFTFQIKK